jgi:hypothetical protein
LKPNIIYYNNFTMHNYGTGTNSDLLQQFYYAQ